MSAIELSLATEEDDRALAAVMREISMPGRMSLSFRREPSYFFGSSVQGTNPQVIIGRECARNTIVGLGAKLDKYVYLNGKIQRCGYLCDLRIKEPYRRRFAISRGYRMLQQLDRADSLPFYLTVIYGQNQSALETLVGRRANLPKYNDLGKIFTPAIFIDRPKREISIPGLSFRQARDGDLDSILSFLTRELPTKQFSPVLDKDQFRLLQVHGLNLSDFYLAYRGGKIVGTVATWEQCAFRQVSIERYPIALGAVRHVYNLVAPIFALRPLPACGQPLRFLYLSFVAIEDNNVNIFRGLLRFIYRERRTGPWNFFVAGLHEKDPLIEVINEYRKLDAYGNLFMVQFPGKENNVRPIDGRIPYFEMACA